jgi:hypothetical protein
MTNPTTLLALAERCEQAAGPDAGLDLAIWKALSEMPGFKHPSPIWRFDVTESLDAAVTLVPEECGWMVMNSAAKVGVWPSHGATPALALCAAALRARAAMVHPAG